MPPSRHQTSEKGINKSPAPPVILPIMDLNTALSLCNWGIELDDTERSMVERKWNKKSAYRTTLPEAKAMKCVRRALKSVVARRRESAMHYFVGSMMAIADIARRTQEVAEESLARFNAARAEFDTHCAHINETKHFSIEELRQKRARPAGGEPEPPEKRQRTD